MNADSDPIVVLIGGPNGAGKTTVAPSFLGSYLNLETFVNADVLAAGLSGLRPETEAIAAGRLMIGHLRCLADDRKSFAFETTLASRTFAPWLRRLMRAGYEFHLLFLWLNSAETAVGRVAGRVRAGGHAVPEEVIRRRYHRGIRNFLHLYSPLATTWQAYDNSGPDRPIPIASGGTATDTQIVEPARWDLLKESIDDRE